MPDADSRDTLKPERAGMLRRLYDWTMSFIQTPYGVWSLFVVAVAESSFFPIPPDVFLIALCMALPKRSFFYAAVCSAGSVLGGMLGYGIGWGFMDIVGNPILVLYGLVEKYAIVQDLYQKNAFMAVAAAGFTPLPYKLFTISAGAFKINFGTFVLASVLSRSARFFLVAAFIRHFGPPIRHFIEKYFNLVATAFFVLLGGGFVLIKLLL